MFQLFLRTRMHNIIMARLGHDGFKARSAERDAETDRLRIGSIVSAIEAALQAAEKEQAGLSRRVDEVLARAAVTLGNGTDEYLEREPLDSHHQDLFDIEILNGQRRLKELAIEIGHFRSIMAAVLSKFPDYRAPPPAPNN
jgi:hypothetical protein